MLNLTIVRTEKSSYAGHAPADSGRRAGSLFAERVCGGLHSGHLCKGTGSRGNHLLPLFQQTSHCGGAIPRIFAAGRRIDGAVGGCARGTGPRARRCGFTRPSFCSRRGGCSAVRSRQKTGSTSAQRHGSTFGNSLKRSGGSGAAGGSPSPARGWGSRDLRGLRRTPRPRRRWRHWPSAATWNARKRASPFLFFTRR